MKSVLSEDKIRAFPKRKTSGTFHSTPRKSLTPTGTKLTLISPDLTTSSICSTLCPSQNLGRNYPCFREDVFSYPSNQSSPIQCFPMFSNGFSLLSLPHLSGRTHCLLSTSHGHLQLGLSHRNQIEKMN